MVNKNGTSDEKGRGLEKEIDTEGTLESEDQQKIMKYADSLVEDI